MKLHNYLGSVNTLLKNGVNGLTVVNEQAFDPWGRRREVYNWTTNDTLVPPASIATWLRGFMGHEHLDGFKLINMNARLYDPLLGRLLSVDNLVGNPGSAMGYNRYTYANNNPISYIDPDGNNPFLIAVAVGALISATSHTVQTFYSGQTVSFGGVLQSAALGGVMGGFSFGIGTVFSSTGAIGSSISNTAVRETAKALAHGLLGSGFSAMQGGNAWSGFMSGAFSSGVSSLGAPVLAGLSSEGQYVGGLVLSAGTGAASSALTGGDPWMGAAIGAIGYATNQAMHRHLLNYPKGYSEGTYNRWDKELGEHSNEAVSLKEFYRINKGKSFSGMFGKSGGAINSQPGGPSPRYVFHPRMRGVVIDMRHFLAVGKLGEGFGTAIEIIQSAAGLESGMKYQDFVSNRLGHYFRMEYDTRVMRNPNNAATYISSFLLDYRNVLR